MRTKKVYWWLALGLIPLVVIVYALTLFRSASSALTSGDVWLTSARSRKHPAPRYFSALDGSAVATKAAIQPAVVGIMIDNHPDARPEAGLAAARVVYEAPAEGGITRFLALYPRTAAVGIIGPVRSARPYFIDWAREYGNPLYLHSGGSPDALAELARGAGVIGVNEFYRGSYFWRRPDQTPPHNLYTSSDRWSAFVRAYKISAKKITPWQGWLFATSTAITGLPAITALTIPFTPEDSVVWQYDGGHYDRFVNGSLAADQSGQAITADNVIVQYAPMSVADSVGRQSLDTVGSGQARVLTGSRSYDGRWEKKTINGRTRFYDQDHREIPLAPGRTWVEIVPPDTAVQIAG